MFKKKQITVSPKNKVYQPKYPSFSDKNPLEYPESRPYPFTYPFIRAMSVAGFTGAVMLAPLVGHTQENSQNFAEDANPFPIVTLGLPYRPMMFGTGASYRLTREDVVTFINDVFVSEGLDISTDTLIKRKDFAITVDAYNKEYNIGYIWIDASNEGEGMVEKDSWLIEERKVLNQAEQEKRNLDNIVYQYTEYLKKPEKFLSFEKSYFDKDEELSVLINQLTEALPTFSNEEKRKTFFFEQYKQINLAYYFYYLNTPPPYVSDEVKNWSYDVVKRINDPIVALALLSRFRPVRQHIKYADTPLKETILAEMRAILATKTNKKWRKRNDALIALMNVNIPFYRFKNNTAYQTIITDILKNHKWNKREKQYAQIKTFVDDHTISYAEVLKIDTASQDGAFFIAPIARRDKRSVYRKERVMYPISINEEKETLQFLMKFTSSQEEKDNYQIRIDELDVMTEKWELEKTSRKKYKQRDEALTALIKAEQNQEKKDSIILVQKELRAERRAVQVEEGRKIMEEAKIKALRVLEADVRRYIQWAKSQQGY